MPQVVIVALYKFVSMPDFREIREPLTHFCLARDIKGTLLLAHEGVNGTMSGSRDAIDQLLDYLRSDTRLADIEHKESYEEDQPFYRLKIKLKKEIVTMGVDHIDPNDSVGTYISPREWNALIQDPEVVVIDTRNHYEYAMGTFERAIDPNTDSFRELPQFIDSTLDPDKHKKVAMFCTGGIRCEKSTAYMKQQGFKEVYHLKGGILKYLEEVPQDQSLWRGECFVFDNRVTVTHGLEKGQYDLCHGCRYPIGQQDKQSPFYEEGVTCPRCYEELTPQQRARFSERQKQMMLAKTRGDRHIGAPAPDRQQKNKNKPQ